MEFEIELNDVGDFLESNGKRKDSSYYLKKGIAWFLSFHTATNSNGIPNALLVTVNAFDYHGGFARWTVDVRCKLTFLNQTEASESLNLFDSHKQTACSDDEPCQEIGFFSFDEIRSFIRDDTIKMRCRLQIGQLKRELYCKKKFSHDSGYCSAFKSRIM